MSSVLWLFRICPLWNIFAQYIFQNIPSVDYYFCPFFFFLLPNVIYFIWELYLGVLQLCMKMEYLGCAIHKCFQYAVWALNMSRITSISVSRAYSLKCAVKMYLLFPSVQFFTQLLWDLMNFPQEGNENILENVWCSRATPDREKAQLSISLFWWTTDIQQIFNK